MNSIDSTFKVEEGAPAPGQLDYEYTPEVGMHTPQLVPIDKDSLGLVLKCQAGIRGILAVVVGVEATDERISGYTLGNLNCALSALCEVSYDQLAQAVKQAEAALPRH